MTVLFVLSPVSRAQNAAPAQKPVVAKAEQLADEWFTRLNELDDWYISVDGKEENTSVVDRFVELYSVDAYHQVGPSESQIGSVVYHGPEGIRKWADEFSKKYVAVNYRVEYKTRKEQTLQPFYTITLPWGGTGASTEFAAVYTNRQDRRQFVVPGSIFFLFDAAGKIESVRLYLLRDEAVEIGA
jgi:hypothetical protein